MAPPIRAVRWDGQELDAAGSPLVGRMAITKADGNPATLWLDQARTRPAPYLNTRRDGSWTTFLEPGLYTVTPPGGTAYGIFVPVGLEANYEVNGSADGTQVLLGESTMLRRDASLATATLANQAMLLTYWTAVKTEVITQLATYSGTTAAAATPTLCRAGVFSIAADGSGTLVASIANDTTMWAGTNTKYTRNLAAPWLKQAGQRYAVGLLCVTGTTAPTTLSGPTQLLNPDYFEEPRLTAQISGQSDLPSTFTASAPASVGRAGIFARLLP